MRQNWINWKRVIIDADGLSFGAKGMALYLSTYMNDSHDMAYPGLARICGEMNLSKTTAIKYIDELVEAGFLEKQRRFHSSNVYTAVLSESTESELLGESKSKSRTTKVQNLDTNIQENIQDIKTHADPVKPDQRKNAIPFEQFWNRYPRKQGSKQKAHSAWKRLSIAKQEAAMKDFPVRYGGVEPRYVPYPTTYINGRYWEGEMPWSVSEVNPLGLSGNAI